MHPFNVPLNLTEFTEVIPQCEDYKDYPGNRILIKKMKNLRFSLTCFSNDNHKFELFESITLYFL